MISLASFFAMHLAFVLFQVVVVVVAAPWPLVVLPPPQAHFVSEQLFMSTEDRSDCCMLSIVEWGHARLEYEEDISLFDDQDHMDFIGEFTFRVNEALII